MSFFNHFPIADFGLKNQILAWTNDARFVFEQNCNHSRHWTVVDRNPTQKGLKLFTFQSSLREIRGNWHILLSRLGVRDPARKVMLECDSTSKHLRRKKMQPPKPKSKIYLEISVSHSFCTKMYKQFWWRSAPAKTVDTWGISFRNICFAMFFPFANGGGPFKHHT